MGDVIALPLPGAAAFVDARGRQRTLQVTWHDRDEVFVLSIWRLGTCVGSVRLSSSEAASLIGVLAENLGDRAEGASR